MSLFQPTPEKLQKKQAILTVSFPQSWQREFIWMIQQWLICDQRLGLVYCFAGIVLLLVIISFLYSWATYSSPQGAIHSRYLFHENPFQVVCMSLLGHTHSRLFAFPIFPAMSSSCASDCFPNVSEQKRSGKAAITLGGGGKWESYLFFGYCAFTNRNGDSWSSIRMETSQMVSKEGMWPLVCGFLMLTFF